MRIVAMSDTHNKHDKLVVPDGNVLIHCGDFSSWGSPVDVIKFVKWFAAQPHEHKIVVAGNHDRALENEHSHACEEMFMTSGIWYLRDKGIVIDDVNFYGSPWQPAYWNWAFNLPRGRKLAEKWAFIPDDTDVLITHGPPYGILDKNAANQNVGCKDLMERLEQVRPKYHVFGHIHENFGMEKHNETTFVNVSMCNLSYQVKREPVVFDF